MDVFFLQDLHYDVLSQAGVLPLRLTEEESHTCEVSKTNKALGLSSPIKAPGGLSRRRIGQSQKCIESQVSPVTRSDECTKALHLDNSTRQEAARAAESLIRETSEQKPHKCQSKTAVKGSNLLLVCIMIKQLQLH